MQSSNALDQTSAFLDVSINLGTIFVPAFLILNCYSIMNGCFPIRRVGLIHDLVIRHYVSCIDRRERIGKALISSCHCEGSAGDYCFARILFVSAVKLYRVLVNFGFAVLNRILHDIPAQILFARVPHGDRPGYFSRNAVIITAFHDPVREVFVACIRAGIINLFLVGCCYFVADVTRKLPVYAQSTAELIAVGQHITLPGFQRVETINYKVGFSSFWSTGCRVGNLRFYRDGHTRIICLAAVLF